VAGFQSVAFHRQIGGARKTTVLLGASSVDTNGMVGKKGIADQVASDRKSKYCEAVVVHELGHNLNELADEGWFWDPDAGTAPDINAALEVSQYAATSKDVLRQPWAGAGGAARRTPPQIGVGLEPYSTGPSIRLDARARNDLLPDLLLRRRIGSLPFALCHSGCGASAFTRSSANASWKWIGCSAQSVPSLSNVAIRSRSGTKSAPPGFVTRPTNSTIAFFDAPSFQEGSGSAPPDAGLNARRAAMSWITHRPP
jgi:hypothetical protein